VCWGFHAGDFVEGIPVMPDGKWKVSCIRDVMDGHLRPEQSYACYFHALVLDFGRSSPKP